MFSTNAKDYWCDGGCTGNGSDDAKAYGSISDGTTVLRQDWPECKTNNEAEYATLVWLLQQFPPDLGPTIWTDSKLLVGQLTLGWKVKAKNLEPYHEVAWLLLARTKAKLKWVSRDTIVERLGH